MVLGGTDKVLGGTDTVLGGTDHHELDEHGEGVGLHVHARGVSEVIV